MQFLPALQKLSGASSSSTSHYVFPGHLAEHQRQPLPMPSLQPCTAGGARADGATLLLQRSSGRVPKPWKLTAAAGLGVCGGLAGSWHASRRRSARRVRSSWRRAAAAPAAAVASKEKIKKEKNKVVLMGDSVLDNFFWLETPQRHLRVQLEEAMLSSEKAELREMACVNLAIDQMSTFDFIERREAENPWSIYATCRLKVDFADEEDKHYVVDADGVARSVKNLEKLDKVSWVVLSLGGNDVYLNRGIQSSLASSLLPGSETAREQVAKEFAARYRKVLEAVRSAAPPQARLVLVIPYHPHSAFSIVLGDAVGDGDVLGSVVLAFERTFLSTLVSPMVREILTIAKEEHCPVVDLSKTFDVNCDAHYGTGQRDRVNSLGVSWSGAEPSDESTAFIATLLLAAMSCEREESCVFQGEPLEDADGWSLVVEERPNDDASIKKYRFGPAVSSRVADDSSGLWFGVGVAFAALGNFVSFLDASEGQPPLAP